MTNAFFIFIFALYGGALYRWRGHASEWKKYFPRPWPQLLFALPYAALVAPRPPLLYVFIQEPLHCLYGWVFMAGPYWWVVAAIVLPLTWGAISTGHGQYFPDLQAKYLTPERLDFLLRPFFGKDPRTMPTNWIAGGTYATDADFYHWAITHYGWDKLRWRCFCGMALTGLAVTLPAGIALMNPLLALSGIVKALGYQISEDGAMREFYAGFLMYLALGVFV